MMFSAEAFIAIAVIAVVAIAAVSYEPAKPFGPWLKLAERYATDKRPSQIIFSDQKIHFSARRGAFKMLSDFARFDATIDDFGLWLIYKGGEPQQLPRTLKIPGTHVRSLGQKSGQHVFELYAEPPLKIAVAGEFGEVLSERCQPAMK